MFGTGDPFEYLECRKCGSMQQLSPPLLELSAYYPNEYYAYVTLNYSSAFRKFLKRIRWRLYRLVDIKPFWPLWGDWIKRGNVQLNDKIADIGCGNGQLLYEMYASGFPNLIGVDPFIENSQRINSSLLLLMNSF